MVTFSSAILAVVTFASAILSVVTLLSTMFAVAILTPLGNVPVAILL